MSDRKEQLRNILIQFGTVFFSVVLALLADDWRASKIESAEEHQILLQMRGELAEDAKYLDMYRIRLARRDSASSRFIQQLQSAAPIDTLLQSATMVTRIWNYRPTYPTYNGLSRSGDLDLIHDSGLRQAIVAYHDDQIVLIDDLRAASAKRIDKMNEYLREYFGYRPDSLESWEYVFYGSHANLLKDKRLLAEIGHSGRGREALANRIASRTIPMNEELQGKISAYLE